MEVIIWKNYYKCPWGKKSITWSDLKLLSVYFWCKFSQPFIHRNTHYPIHNSLSNCGFQCTAWIRMALPYKGFFPQAFHTVLHLQTLSAVKSMFRDKDHCGIGRVVIQLSGVCLPFWCCWFSFVLNLFSFGLKGEGIAATLCFHDYELHAWVLKCSEKKVKC